MYTGRVQDPPLRPRLRLMGFNDASEDEITALRILINRAISQAYKTCPCIRIFSRLAGSAVWASTRAWRKPAMPCASSRRAANQGVHTGNSRPAGRDGGHRGASPVHADARSGEAELRHHHIRLHRRVLSGQDARGVHEPHPRPDTVRVIHPFHTRLLSHSFNMGSHISTVLGAVTAIRSLSVSDFFRRDTLAVVPRRYLPMTA